MSETNCNNRMVLWLRRRYHKMMIWLYVGDLGDAHPQERIKAYDYARKHFEAIERLEHRKPQNGQR